MKTKKFKNVALGYVHFVAGKVVNPLEKPNIIYVYSQRKGTRINKNKTFFVGWVVKRKNGKYYFSLVDKLTIHEDTLRDIYAFIYHLKKGNIVFDIKSGEIKI